MKLSLVVALFLALAGCAGQVESTPPVDPCAGAPTHAACAQCYQHAPRGIAGAETCQTAVDGPPGATCCSITATDGSCVAIYVEDGREFAAACTPPADVAAVGRY